MSRLFAWGLVVFHLGCFGCGEPFGCGGAKVAGEECRLEMFMYVARGADRLESCGPVIK